MVKILLVDDDELVRFSLCQVLRKAGYEVIEATDGGEVYALLNDARPDMLVIDIVMPRKEGIATIIETRASWPNLPIIAISGGGRLSHVDYLEEARALGANATLRKPFENTALLSAIDQLKSSD